MLAPRHDKQLSPPARVVNGKVDEVFEDSAFSHRICSGPLRQLELGQTFARPKVVWMGGIVASRQRGATLDDLVGLEHGRNDQADAVA